MLGRITKTAIKPIICSIGKSALSKATNLTFSTKSTNNFKFNLIRSFSTEAANLNKNSTSTSSTTNYNNILVETRIGIVR